MAHCSRHASRAALELSVTTQIRAADKLLRERIADLFKDAPHGGAPMIILRTLSKASTAMTLSALADRVELSGASVCRLVKVLEREGLVQKARDGRDARLRLIGLTAQGRLQSEAYDRRSSTIRRNMFKDASDAELATVHSVLGDALKRARHGTVDKPCDAMGQDGNADILGR